MNYLNLDILSTIKSETYLGCEPVDRSTWMGLIGYCASQENGGRIEGCHEWGDRKWMQVCGITLAEVKRKCPLWAWLDDGSIEVWRYPAEQEAIVQQKRELGRRGAEKRWGSQTAEAAQPELPAGPTDSERQPQAKANAKPTNSKRDSERQGKPVANAIANATKIGCGMEGKEKKRNPPPKQVTTTSFVSPHDPEKGRVFATQTSSGAHATVGALALQPALAQILRTGEQPASVRPRMVIEGTLDPPPRNDIAEARKRRQMGKTIAEICAERLANLGATQPHPHSTTEDEK